MTDFAVKADGLCRSFGTLAAVDGIGLQVPEGQLYGFLGLNGAGKTTIRMLTTLLPPTRGHARIWGHDVTREPLAVRRLIGLVSDETSESQGDRTAREYLAYFAGLRGLPHPADLVERRLVAVGLEESFRGKLISTFSTGMKRRVEIARALLGDPKVLFLDEPTRGVDLPAKRDTWALLRDLAARNEVTTFLSSHDTQEIRSLCTEISVIAKGRLVHEGPAASLGDTLDSFEDRSIGLLTARDGRVADGRGAPA